MKKLNLSTLERYFIVHSQSIFTARDVQLIFDVEKRAVDAFLFYNVKKGAIVRLKAGLFSLSNNMPHEYIIANRLCIPSYISLDTALSYYNLIPESIYAITSITSKATKKFEVNGLSYVYNKIKKEAFVGYNLCDIEGENVYLASSEKAVADFLYYVFFKKRIYNDRLDWSKINFKLVVNYLKLFSRKKIIRFAQSIYKKYA